MWRIILPLIAMGFSIVSTGAEPIVGGPCDGCEAAFVELPQNLTSKSRIAPASEAGEPMLITGRVLARDGKPKAGVIIYAYHADAHGIYPRPAKSLGAAADRHGRLRGWAISDADGRYTFETIRPASYPSRDIPAHVHMHVIERACAAYYIDDIVFTDDPLLMPAERARLESGRGGIGVTTPARDSGSGVWKVVRDIHLGANVPDYPACEASARNRN